MDTRVAVETGPRNRKTEAGVRELAEMLGRVMADTYVLYFQTQSFHWNVRGPQFYSLHSMFEEQYEHLAEAADTLAERLRGLGALAPTSLGEIASLSSIPLDHGVPPARDMVELLLRGHEHLARATRDTAGFAERVDDGVTHDIMISRAMDHEKTAWMLRATLHE
jgi:starvation-inducible DNA-binding protein